MDNGIALSALPERTSDQIASARVQLLLGGEVKSLPVLPIRANREWTALVTAEVNKTLEGLPQVETFDQVAIAMGGAIDSLIALLVAYDRDGVLGGADWLEEHAAPGEVYEAFKEVASAAFPFGLDLMKAIPEVRQAMIREMVRDSLQRTSASPPPTAGRRTRSSRK